MVHIRAKFRCMNVTDNWNKQRTVNLKPVMNGPSNCEENKLFWKYTPAGECQMSGLIEELPGFEIGAYYYIDMEPAEVQGEEDSKAWYYDEKVERRGDVGFKVTLAQQSPWSTLWMSLTSRSVFLMFGELGSKWNVVFTKTDDAT